MRGGRGDYIHIIYEVWNVHLPGHDSAVLLETLITISKSSFLGQQYNFKWIKLVSTCYVF